MQLTVAAKASLCIMLSWRLFGQEFSVPASQNKPMPEAAIYRIFITHVATFELAARAAEAQGKSDAPWRNHLLHKYGITKAEQQSLASTVLTYHSQMNDLRARIKTESTAFTQQYFPGGKSGVSISHPYHSPAIHALKQQEDSLTLATKDQLHTQLGDTRFAGLDEQIHFQIARLVMKKN